MNLPEKYRNWSAYRCPTSVKGGCPEASSLDSFSPRGEACVTDRTFFLLSSNVEISTKGFSLEGEAVKNRLFGTDF